MCWFILIACALLFGEISDVVMNIQQFIFLLLLLWFITQFFLVLTTISDILLQMKEKNNLESIKQNKTKVLVKIG